MSQLLSLSKNFWKVHVLMGLKQKSLTWDYIVYQKFIKRERRRVPYCTLNCIKLLQMQSVKYCRVFSLFVICSFNMRHVDKGMDMCRAVLLCCRFKHLSKMKGRICILCGAIWKPMRKQIWHLPVQSNFERTSMQLVWCSNKARLGMGN